MVEALLEAAEELFKGKAFLTLDDISEGLNLSRKAVYNWTRRTDERRPPQLQIGKTILFPRKEFFRWLAKEHGSGGELGRTT